MFLIFIIHFWTSSYEKKKDKYLCTTFILCDIFTLFNCTNINNIHYYYTTANNNNN